MPRQIDLREIAAKNPNFDSDKLEELEQLKKFIDERGPIQRQPNRAFPFRGRRAQIVDDAANDSRVIKLRRKR